MNKQKFEGIDEAIAFAMEKVKSYWIVHFYPIKDEKYLWEVSWELSNEKFIEMLD
jgi:hypothetical protein